MQAFLIVLVIWIVIAFIYKLVKGVGFFKAFARIPLIIISWFLDEVSGKAKRNADQAKNKKQWEEEDKYRQVSDIYKMGKNYVDNFMDDKLQ